MDNIDNIGVPVKAAITLCNGGDAVTNFIHNPHICDYCGKEDTTEYEFEITVYLKHIQTKSYTYCCTDCHNLNCPIHASDC